MKKTPSVLRKILHVQISGEDKEEQKSKYYIPVCLEKVRWLKESTHTLLPALQKHGCGLDLSSQGCSDTFGFIQTVLGLLLPLGYEYNPGLVLLVRMPESRVADSMWQQLIGLMQSFAKGHTLVLMQVRRLQPSEIYNSLSSWFLLPFFRRMKMLAWALLLLPSSVALHLLCETFWLRSKMKEII